MAVLSVGGNDVTPYIGLLRDGGTSAADLLEQLLVIADEFGRRYEEVAHSVAQQAQRTILCTIYEVALEPASLARLARVPLALLNDRIIRAATRLGCDVLDLRGVATQPQDFVRQIEPSAQGARKLAEAIARLLAEPAPAARARVFAG